MTKPIEDAVIFLSLRQVHPSAAPGTAQEFGYLMRY